MAVIRKEHSVYTPALHYLHSNLCKIADDPELDPMNPDSPFFVESCLQSAGGIPYKKIQTQEAFVTNRETQMCIGDSAGFQARTNEIKQFDWSDPFSASNDEVRLNLLQWGERNCDINMLFDIPPFGDFLENKFGKNVISKCLEVSKYNFRFNVENRTNPDTLWLNCVQGTTLEECKHWFHEVKEFMPYTNGWGFGTFSMKSMNIGLPLIRYMLDNNGFDDGNDWIHSLGISPPKTTFAYNSIQRVLRKLLGSELQITYDSSSPLQISRYGNFYPIYTITPTRTIIETLPFLKNGDFDLEAEYPYGVVKRKIGDLMCNETSKHGPTTYGYWFAMIVSVHTFIQATEFINKVNAMPDSYKSKLVEPKWVELDGIIEEYLTTEKPDTVFEKHSLFLKKAVLDSSNKNNNILKHGLFS